MTALRKLVLSLFPGADLLGRGFERDFCVVRGPDILWGGDVREFTGTAGVFEGIIGGPPCQDFSAARRTPPTGEGTEMIGHFLRIVTECQPVWWVMENVPRVPDITVTGYRVQRLDLDARQFGLPQRRLRHVQIGTRDGTIVVMHRGVTNAGPVTERTCLATEGVRPDRRTWEHFCRLQGLTRPLELPGLSRAARYRIVGNGVPLPMAAALCQAVVTRRPVTEVRVCGCGCGRSVTGRQSMATAACRKRMQRRRDGARVTQPGAVTIRAKTD